MEALATKVGSAFGQGNDRLEQATERGALAQLTAGLQRYGAGKAWLAANGPLKLDSPEPVKAEAANLLAELRRQAEKRTAAKLPPEPPSAADFQRQARATAARQLRRDGAANPTEQQIDARANAIMSRHLPAGAAVRAATAWSTTITPRARPAAAAPTRSACPTPTPSTAWRSAASWRRRRTPTTPCGPWGAASATAPPTTP